jgi:glycosyltransferase involved in cell wall biosynthesis
LDGGGKYVTTPSSPAATVLITTKNRKSELRTAIVSALTQDAAPRVLVIDDGSTDGTSEMIRSEFPQVRLDRAESSLGLIVQRNRGAALCDTPFLFSIDDDAAFSTPNVVSQTLAEIQHPCVGAVAIPFINVNQDQTVRQLAPDEHGVYLYPNYIGTAHCLRRDLFLRLGGYREFLFHQGEEEDYCIRMLNAGYVVRLGRADPIHHFESPRRDLRRMDLYGRRNNILFAWCNVPMPYLPGRLLTTTFNGLRFGFKVGRPGRMVHGLAMGYAQIFRRWSQRRPVDPKVWLLHRRITLNPGIQLSDIQLQLPPTASVG